MVLLETDEKKALQIAESIRKDIAALRALEAKTSRAHALDVIREELGEIDFTHYPMDNARFLRFRERIVEEAG